MYRDVRYTDFASLQGGNLLEQCRSNCRGAQNRFGKDDVRLRPERRAKIIIKDEDLDGQKK
jgi:hypothetical protein